MLLRKQYFGVIFILYLVRSSLVGMLSVKQRPLLKTTRDRSAIARLSVKLGGPLINIIDSEGENIPLLLSQLKKIPYFSTLFSDLSEEEIPKSLNVGKFSVQTIRDVMDIAQLENNEIKDLIKNFSLDRIMLCLEAVHYFFASATDEKIIKKMNELDNIITDQIFFTLAHASFKDIVENKAIDFSSPDIQKKFFRDSLIEILKFLIIKKRANERKIILDGHTAYSQFVLCTPDGTKIVSNGYNKSFFGILQPYPTAIVWDINNTHNKKLKEFKSGFNTALALSDTGEKIIISSNDGSFLYNILQGNSIKLENDSSLVSFNPSGTRLVTYQNPGYIYINKGLLSNFKIFLLDTKSVPVLNNVFIEGSKELNRDFEIPNFMPDDDFDEWTRFSIPVALTDDNTMHIYLAKKSDSGLYENYLLSYNINNIFAPRKNKDEWYVSERGSRLIAFNNKKDACIIVMQTNKKTDMTYYSIKKNKSVRFSRPYDFYVNAVTFSADDSKILQFCQVKRNYYTRIWDINNLDANELETLNVFLCDMHDTKRISCTRGKLNEYTDITLDSFSKHTIMQYLPQSIQLSGLLGGISSIQFSRDGTKVIGTSYGNHDNLIVWPLLTPEEAAVLKILDTVDINTIKVLLGLSIATLKNQSTPISWENGFIATISSLIKDLLLFKVDDKYMPEISDSSPIDEKLFKK